MHIQVVTFNLKGLSESEFSKACSDVFAPAFAEISGLISKVWLRQPETNTYGGVYTWRDREAMERYAKSELFQSIISDKRFINISSQDFSVMEGPTRITHGLAKTAA